MLSVVIYKLQNPFHDSAVVLHIPDDKSQLVYGSFHDKSPQKKFFFNHYISDFDKNWCMWLSYGQTPLVQILRFYD